jgi:drug/metabolite transporter (DMT)-like permease
MTTGARSSPPFRIKSQNLYGGTIHLTTSLAMSGIILSQENHSFEVAPASWLPILSAIIGALLYSLYSIVNDEKRAKIREKIGTGVVAGAIAWLFTGFDLLGLRLDTHSLRTYAVTGFLFAFLGVAVLLSKKFPRTVQVVKQE